MGKEMQSSEPSIWMQVLSEGEETAVMKMVQSR